LQKKSTGVEDAGSQSTTAKRKGTERTLPADDDKDAAGDAVADAHSDENMDHAKDHDAAEPAQPEIRSSRRASGI
jgi:hypothetical protein